MTLSKRPAEHTGDEAAAIFRTLFKEERANIIPQASGITGGQVSAAKGRANKRFFALGF